MERFWDKVDKSGDCWLWLGAKDGTGYGNTWYNNKPAKAHRVAYWLLKGEIPEGLELDHLCRVRNCVNPDHLEPVTHKVNMERSIRSETSHCPSGHEYDDSNTYVSKKGKRMCRTCHRDKMRARRASVA